MEHAHKQLNSPLLFFICLLRFNLLMRYAGNGKKILFQEFERSRKNFGKITIREWKAQTKYKLRYHFWSFIFDDFFQWEIDILSFHVWKQLQSKLLFFFVRRKTKKNKIHFFHFQITVIIPHTLIFTNLSIFFIMSKSNAFLQLARSIFFFWKLVFWIICKIHPDQLLQNHEGLRITNLVNLK